MPVQNISTVKVLQMLLLYMCVQACTTVIITPPSVRLNSFNRRVADAARVTCANVTPAGPRSCDYVCQRYTPLLRLIFHPGGKPCHPQPRQNHALGTPADRRIGGLRLCFYYYGTFPAFLFFGSWVSWLLNISLWVMRRGTTGTSSLQETSSRARWQWWSARKLKCSVFQSRPKEKPRWRGASGKQRPDGCTATRRDISILNILFSRIKRKEMVGIIICLWWLERVCALTTETDVVF